MWEAKWELLLPVVAMGALFSGIFSTPVAAAAVTALYAFVVVTFIHRDLSLRKDVPRVMTECGLLVGGVLLILGMAFGFTNCLVDAQIPDQAIEWVTNTIESKIVFLFALNVLLILVGCFMDIYSSSQMASKSLPEESGIFSMVAVPSSSSWTFCMPPNSRFRLRNWSVIRHRVRLSNQPLKEPSFGSYLNPGIFFETQMTVSWTTSWASVSVRPDLMATP